MIEQGAYWTDNLVITVFFLGTLAFGGGALILARLLRPSKGAAVKRSRYECGVESTDEVWIQFRVQYYILALVFVIFDIETVFLYPWAVAFGKLGLFAFIEMMIFILILVGGLGYAWKKGVLTWR
jgi:NADH-quinone oxidoreductase subunit A